MSSYLPPDQGGENTQPNQPAPPVGPTTPGFVDPNLASRLGRDPGVNLPGASKIPWNQMVNVLNEIRYLNDRIRINTESTATYLKAHVQELQTITDTTPADNLRKTVPGTKENEKAQDSFQDRLAKPNVQQRIEERHMAERRAVLGGTSEERLQQLTNLGMVDDAGNVSLPGGKRLTPTQLEQIAEVHQGKRDVSSLDQELQQSAHKFSDVLDKRLLDTHKDEIRRMQGLENLQSGGLRPGRLLGMFGMHHGLGPTVPPGMSTTVGTGVADIFSRRSFSTKLGDLLASASEKRAAQGAEAGLGTKALGGIADTLLKRMAVGGIPVIGEVLLAGTLLKEFGKNIPGVSQFEQMASAGRRFRQSGQLTGQGVEAGFEAWRQAGVISPGGVASRIPIIGGVVGIAHRILHPFDPMTQQIADEIVQQVRTAGITGDQAMNIERSIADVYRHLGLNVQEVNQMIIDSTRRGGESLRQITGEINTFGNAAHDLTMNVQSYAQSVMASSQMFRSAGAQSRSTALAQTFVASAPRILRDGQGLADYQALYQRAAPQIAAQLGLPQQYLNLPQYANRTMAGFEQTMARELARMPGATPGERAANASRFGILFRGMPVDEILALQRQIASGRGPESQVRLGAIISRMQGQLSGEVRRTTALGSHLSPEQMARLGIHESITHRALRGIGGHETHHFIDAQGNIVDSKRFDVQGDIRTVSSQSIRRAREWALNQARPLLTRNQIQDLTQHIGDRNFNWTREFQRVARRGGPQANAINTPFGEIKITLDKNARKVIRADVQQNNYRYGYVPPNRSFPQEDFRLDPLGP